MAVGIFPDAIDLYLLSLTLVLAGSVTTFQFQGTMQWYSNVWYLPVVMSADWTDKGTATRVVCLNRAELTTTSLIRF